MASVQGVYDSIVQFYRAYGIPPTYRQVCDLSGLSSLSSADYYLRRLVKMGLIVKIKRHPVPVEIKKYLNEFTPTKRSK